MNYDIFSSFTSEELKSAFGNKLVLGVLDAMPVAVALLKASRDSDKQIISFVYAFANKAAEKLAGEPLDGKRLFLNDDALLFNNMVSVADSGLREDFVCHYTEEPEKWIHYSINQFDSGVILTYENVTERKKTAIALQRERARMDEAQAISNTGSFEWDLVENKIYWSDEMYRIHNLEPQSEQITVEKAFGYVHPEDLLRVKKKIDVHTKLPGREEIIYKLKLADGEIKYLRNQLESFRGQSGKITHISGMLQDITARKNTEEEIRHLGDQLKKQSAGKEKREAILEDYGRIIASVHDAIVSIDTKGYIVTWNAAAEKMYGYSTAEAIGRPVAKLIVPENKQTELAELFTRIFKNGENIDNFATTKRCKDGSEIEVVVNIVPLKDAYGKITGAATTSKNITAEKFRVALEAEIAVRTEALQQSEALLKATLDSTLHVIQVFKAVRDQNGEIVDFTWILTNRTWKEKYGDVIGKSLLTENPGAKISGIFERFVRIINTGISERHQHFYKFEQFDGWFDQEIVKLNDGIVMATEDITDRKKAELQLIEQNNFIQSMTTATPDIMFVMDIDTQEILFATKDVAEVMGYSQLQRDNTIHSFLEIMHPEDQPAMIKHIEEMKTAKDGEVREINYRLMHADGSFHWFVDRNVVFRRDEKGIPTEKMGITHDIDSRVNADEKIHSLNKSLTEKNRELRALNNELKTFTSVAAYDYKDTLQTLYTNLEFIISRDAQNLSNAGKANLRKAQTAIQKMKLLTDDIVEFSKIRTPDENPSAVDLNETIGSAFDELSEKMAQATPIIEKEKLPVINGYPFLLDLLFYHLFDNAIKFRNPDEQLKIKISHSISEDRHTGQDVHSISIADNGIGLEQEEASKIFEMFYRIHDKKYRGSGVGLAICKKITELHGGTMAIESEPGKGTTVCCFFPIS
jgi:PAS domain S-box-containing protein